MIRMRWEHRGAPDFTSLVDAVPLDSLHSPIRSVVPLLDMWREPAKAMKLIEGATGLDLSGPYELAFEYAVPVPSGRGKASYTDLMIRTATTSVAVEAKHREPEYEHVRKWLRDPPEPNRTQVLAGWLGLLARVSQHPLSVESVLDLPYQLVHRAASAASTESRNRALVYLLFGDEAAGHYAAHAKVLHSLLGEATPLQTSVLLCRLSPSAGFGELIRTWNDGTREMGARVKSALMEGPAFSFGPCEVIWASRPPQLLVGG